MTGIASAPERVFAERRAPDRSAPTLPAGKVEADDAVLARRRSARDRRARARARPRGAGRSRTRARGRRSPPRARSAGRSPSRGRPREGRCARVARPVIGPGERRPTGSCGAGGRAGSAGRSRGPTRRARPPAASSHAGENVTTCPRVEVPLAHQGERPVEVPAVGEDELQLVVGLQEVEILGQVGVLHAAARRLDVHDLDDARIHAVERDVASRLEQHGLARGEQPLDQRDRRPPARAARPP